MPSFLGQCGVNKASDFAVHLLFVNAVNEDICEMECIAPVVAAPKPLRLRWRRVQSAVVPDELCRSPALLSKVHAAIVRRVSLFLGPLEHKQRRAQTVVHTPSAAARPPPVASIGAQCNRASTGLCGYRQCLVHVGSECHQSLFERVQPDHCFASVRH